MPSRLPIHLVVNLGDVDITKIVGVVAYEEGIYKRNGLEVEQYITPFAARTIEGSGVKVPPQHVRTIEAPLTIGGGVPLIYSRVTNSRAFDRVILATFDDVVHWNIIARAGIAKLEDIKGKRLGFTNQGAMTHYIALAFAKRMGWDPTMDLSLMADAGALDALQKGLVDAFISPGVALVAAKNAGLTPLADLRDWNLPIAGSGIQATAGWIKANEEATRRFIKSMIEAIAVMRQDKNAAFRGMAVWFNITDPKQQAAIYEAQELPAKPYPSAAGVKTAMEIYDSHEMRTHKPEDFYDDRFVQARSTKAGI